MTGDRHLLGLAAFPGPGAGVIFLEHHLVGVPLAGAVAGLAGAAGAGAAEGADWGMGREWRWVRLRKLGSQERNSRSERGVSPRVRDRADLMELRHTVYLR